MRRKRAQLARRDAPEPRCPHCGADLRGGIIPVGHRENYGGATHFERQIGIVEHDRVARSRCPDCGGEWGPRC